MARSVPYTLTSARRCTLVEALLLLLLGAGLSWVGSALDGTDVPAEHVRLLADVARFAVIGAVAGVAIAWGLGRATRGRSSPACCSTDSSPSTPWSTYAAGWTG